jgi:hypothetical protein
MFLRVYLFAVCACRDSAPKPARAGRGNTNDGQQRKRALRFFMNVWRKG